MLYVARILYYEQLAGIRKTLSPLRTNSGRHEVPRVLRAILVRRDLFIHIAAQFPNMHQYLDIYGSEQWYEKNYQISSKFVKSGTPAPQEESDEDVDDVRKNPLPDGDGGALCSSYLCHSILVTLCEKLNRGILESSLCQLAVSCVPGKELDLAMPDNAICKALAEAASKCRFC
jgi:hypothetical protein